MTLDCLRDILNERALHALFQPVMHMDTGAIIGYEGLIRGPAGSALHLPGALFAVARASHLTLALEQACVQVVLEQFAQLHLPGKVFVNMSPVCLIHLALQEGDGALVLGQSAMSAERIIIELTEFHATHDYHALLRATHHFKDRGVDIAIDDLGEGFSSLRLWSELRPAYVKIDMHFIQGINLDPIKLQFVRSIQQIAESAGAMVIAEGIETRAELLIIRDLGVAFGQGFHIARPTAVPMVTVPAGLMASLVTQGVQLYPRENHGSHFNQTVAKLMVAVTPVSSQHSNIQVYDLFASSPSLQVLPVVDQGKPIGLLTRASIVDQFARPYLRELHGRKSCTTLMDPHPLIVDHHTSVQELSRDILDSGEQHLNNGFILTRDGLYLGMGTGRELMRELTQLQISAARYANPLTFLPGNVPIVEHIERLLESNSRFWACYVDLDAFKPYNDVYGFRKGDDVLQLTGKVLEQSCDPARDFLGHIGGDDFFILFQSEDWERRCEAITQAFSGMIAGLYSRSDLERGGCVTEDRRGTIVVHPLLTISLGVVRVEPGQYLSHHQISVAAAEAKKQAKKMIGNSVFIERRTVSLQAPCLAASD